MDAQGTMRRIGAARDYHSMEAAQAAMAADGAGGGAGDG